MEYLGPKIHWLEKLPTGAHYAKTKPRDSKKPRLSQVEAGPYEKLTAAATALPSTANVIIPRQTTLAIRIVDHATKIVINLSFVNASKRVIQDGYFTFPFPAGCSLTKFRCFIGAKRVLTSKVKPLNKAVAEYQAAVSNSKSAALFAQRTAEIFTVCLGNIPPDTTLRAEVSLVMLLKDKLSYPDRITTLTLPTYIAPRYGDPPSNLVNSTTKDTKHDLSLELEVVSGANIIDITSSTHAISVQKSYGPRPCHSWNEFVKADSARGSVHLASAKLSKPISTLDGDIVFDVVTRPQDQLEAPQAWIETHPSLTDHHTIMLNIPANALLKPRNDADDSEILFLADRSGSMDDKIPALKSAMQFFLKGLPPKRRFNIWSFGSEFSSLWPKSKVYSRETLNEAERHVRKEFDANLGGTELLPALKEIFKSRSTTGTATTDIIILTDGEVWREEETVEFINSARKHSSYSARFFCLGIGPAVSHSLVEGIAKNGGGYAEVVPASQKSGWEDRIVRMLKAALHNHIGPIQLEVGENTANGFRQWKTSSFLQTPAATTSFSPFVTNRVFLLFEDSGVPVHRAVIALKTNGANGKEGTHFLKPTASDEPDLLLHTLAARGLLQDLESGQSQKHQDHASGHAIRREGERISCTYSLLSKWTCFIAVEEDQRSDNILSDIIQESIAAICKLEPSGWNPDLQRNIGRIPKGQYLLDATSADRSSDSESGGESGSYNDSDNESDDSRDEPPPPPPPPPPPTNGNGPSKGSGSGSGSSSGSGSGTGPSSGRGSGPSSSGNGSDPNTSGSNSGATDGAGNSNGASMNSRATGSDSSDANHSGAGPSDLGSLQLNTNGRQAIASLDSRSLLADQTKPEISHEVGLQDGRKGPPFHKNIVPKVLRNILLRAIETNAPPSTPSLEIPSYWADEEERACLKSTEMPCIVVPAQDPNVGARTKYPYRSMPPLHNSPQLNHWQRNSHSQNWEAQPTVQPKSQQISQPTSQPTSYSTAYSTAYPTSQPLETILYLPRDRISQSQAPQDTYQTASSATERFTQETARYDEVPGKFGNANHAIDGAGVIRRLIQLQDFDGGFNASSQNSYMVTQPPLHDLFGRNFSILYSYIETLMENVSYSQYSLGKSEIISTVAVLAILRSHLSGYKDMWILLEERAERYLGTRLNSVEELVSKAFEKAKLTNFDFTSHDNSSFPIYPPYPPHPYSGVSLNQTMGNSLNSYSGYGGNPTTSNSGYGGNPRNHNFTNISPNYYDANTPHIERVSPSTSLNIASTPQSSHEQSSREQSSHEQSSREQSSHEQSSREQSSHEQSSREQSYREQGYGAQSYQAQGPFEQTMRQHIM